MTEPDVPVGIVGAGAVGLACALRLATFGVRSVILEAEPALRPQGSKACCIQGDVLEVLDKVGCGQRLAAEGIAWHVARTYVRGREISTTVYPAREGFPPFLNISQFRTEEVLLERLREGTLSEVRWSHRVCGVAQDGGGVTVTVSTPDGTREMRFPYLVACDGVHSDLRRLTGVEWTGYSHGDRFLITDIRAPLPLAHERHFHYDPPFNPGRQLVMHAQPDNVWRIDWQLPPETDIEAERKTDKLDRRIRDVIGDVPYQVCWMSTYRFHQRVVARMRLGRIFFAGDAAHALPPYGARGMNSGIQDVDNLAWKLDLVLSGRAGETLLETYHVERHAAARENLRVTEATIRFMVPPTPLRRWTRNALLRLQAPFRFLRRHVNSGRMAEPFVYAGSPIVDELGGSPLVGAFAPDGFVSAAGRRRRLRELFGEEFVCLHFGADPGEARRFAEQALARPLAVPLRLHLVLPAGAETGALPPQASVLHDEGPGLRATYCPGPPTWYLVRPDGHIAAARGAEAAAAELADVLRSSADAVPGLRPVLIGA